MEKEKKGIEHETRRRKIKREEMRGKKKETRNQYIHSQPFCYRLPFQIADDYTRIAARNLLESLEILRETPNKLYSAPSIAVYHEKRKKRDSRTV